MSALSEFWKHKSYIFEEAIQYLDNYAGDLTGEQKAKLVVELLKQFHIASGGIWGPLIEQAVLAVIDYELAQIRERKKDVASPATPPVQAAIYGNFDKQPVPDHAALLSQGYKNGDVVWGYGATLYTVVQPGSVPPLTAPDGTTLGSILLTI